MPLTASVIEDVYDCALNALDHGLATCAINDRLFHKTTPDLPFGVEEIVQLVGYMQRHKLFASGLRLEDAATNVRHSILLISRTHDDLQTTIKLMRKSLTTTSDMTVIGHN